MPTNEEQEATRERGDETLTAIHPNGGQMYFNDYAREGDEIEVENGGQFAGVFILERDEDDWTLRDLTDEENRARNERILSEAIR